MHSEYNLLLCTLCILVPGLLTYLEDGWVAAGVHDLRLQPQPGLIYALLPQHLHRHSPAARQLSLKHLQVVIVQCKW